MVSTLLKDPQKSSGFHSWNQISHGAKNTCESVRKIAKNSEAELQFSNKSRQKNSDHKAEAKEEAATDPIGTYLGLTMVPSCLSLWKCIRGLHWYESRFISNAKVVQWKRILDISKAYLVVGPKTINRWIAHYATVVREADTERAGTINFRQFRSPARPPTYPIYVLLDLGCDRLA